MSVSLELHSPASLVSPGEPLDGDGSVTLAQVLLAREPTADGFLDADAGGAQLVRPQLLQVGNLACSEEDLGLAKLIFVLVLRNRKKRSKEKTFCIVLTREEKKKMIGSIHCSNLNQFLKNIPAGQLLVWQHILVLHQHSVSAEELLIGPPKKHRQVVRIMRQPEL